MITLIIYAFIAYGITTIATEGDIFTPLRDWIGTKSQFVFSIFTCPLCFSTWLGFALAAILIIFEVKTPIDLVAELPIIVNIFLTGCYTAGTTWFLYKINNK